MHRAIDGNVTHVLGKYFVVGHADGADLKCGVINQNELYSYDVYECYTLSVS